MNDDPFLTYLVNTIDRIAHMIKKEQEKIDMAIAMRSRREAELETLQEAIVIYQRVKSLKETS